MDCRSGWQVPRVPAGAALPLSSRNEPLRPASGNSSLRSRSAGPRGGRVRGASSWASRCTSRLRRSSLRFKVPISRRCRATSRDTLASTACRVRRSCSSSARLLRLLRLQALEVGLPGPGLRRQLAQLREVALERRDLLGARLRRIGEVVHAPRQLAGVLEAQHQTQRLALSSSDTAGAAGSRADPAGCARWRRAWLWRAWMRRELAAYRPLLGGELEQAPVGLADRALRFAQRVGGLRLRVLRLGKLLLQPLDAAAQLLEVVRRVRLRPRPQQPAVCSAPAASASPTSVTRLELARRRARQPRWPCRFQALALPWDATALTAASTRAWSPR